MSIGYFPFLWYMLHVAWLYLILCMWSTPTSRLYTSKENQNPRKCHAACKSLLQKVVGRIAVVAVRSYHMTTTTAWLQSERTRFYFRCCPDWKCLELARGPERLLTSCPMAIQGLPSLGPWCASWSIAHHIIQPRRKQHRLFYSLRLSAGPLAVGGEAESRDYWHAWLAIGGWLRRGLLPGLAVDGWSEGWCTWLDLLDEADEEDDSGFGWLAGLLAR